jgi:hypothetical protein
MNGRFTVSGGYDPPVRIPDVVLKCVAFVGEATLRSADGAVSGDLLATGFFVSVPLFKQVRVPRFVYFVTAKHVASDLAGREAYFLANKKGGGVKPIETVVGNEWHLHPSDPTADIALIQVGVDRDLDVDTVGIEDFGTPERLKELNVGIGDLVHSTGLFTPAPGQQRNMPIVRVGNIAMMPEEQIQTELGFADVFLIEAHSLGGISGSPVFVRPTINFKLPPEMARSGVNNAFWYGHGATLLGLMHGHWDIRESEMNQAFFTHDRKHGVNMGIAIVVPAIKILETLFSPELAIERERMSEKIKRAFVPGTDSAREKKETEKAAEQSPFTRDDFEDALKKASRKIAPESKQ